MLSFFVGLALKVGIPQRFAKAAVIALAVIVAVAAFAGLKACYDDSIIDEHTAEQRAAVAEADRKADANSAVERRADDARAATEADEIKEAITDAGPNPADRRAAYYACVKLQQAARRDNKPPSDC
jgi:hypothetical protein